MAARRDGRGAGRGLGDRPSGTDAAGRSEEPGRDEPERDGPGEDGPNRDGPDESVGQDGSGDPFERDGSGDPSARRGHGEHDRDASAGNGAGRSDGRDPKRAVPSSEERLVDGLDDRTATHFADGRTESAWETPHALVLDSTPRGEAGDLVPPPTARAEEEFRARRFSLSPVGERRWRTFKANRRGYVSLWLFLALFVVTLFAEFVANDRPLLVRFDGESYFPVFVDYPETVFGGDFDTSAEYRDPFVAELIEEKGWMLWPPVRYAHDTVNYDLPVPAPAPPSAENLLGTDDQGRDVLARIIYGFRISVLFGLTLTLTSSIIGVAVGAVQGYLGGMTDLVGQRILEIWSGLPVLYLLIVLASIVEPNFWWLLGLMLLFSWMSLVGVVRAEVLRARNLDYVKAAAALGVGRWTILLRHVLPNAMVATLTFLPFILNGSITTLTSLDFLGFGLPPGSASLGELLAQGKQNLQAPWLGITAFVVLAVMLSLLIFIGEAVRDAFDPRKSGR